MGSLKENQTSIAIRAVSWLKIHYPHMINAFKLTRARSGIDISMALQNDTVAVL